MLLHCLRCFVLFLICLSANGIHAQEADFQGDRPDLRALAMDELLRNNYSESRSSIRWRQFQKMRKKSLSRNGSAPAADWKSIGPTSMEGHVGRMISHAFDPQNSAVVWAGSATGGLWKTENGGELWQPVTDQIPSTGVGAVAVNPQNPNSLIIGTGEGYYFSQNDVYSTIRPGLGVFKSTDRGMGWLQMNFKYQYKAGVAVFKIIWDPVDTNRIYMAATNGIWLSTDAGLNWTLKKGDGTNQATAVATDLLQHPAGPDTLYAAIRSDGIYKSIDRGESWKKTGSGLPVTDLGFISIDLCRDQPNVLYASISTGQSRALLGLYRSDNSGAGWSKINLNFDPFCPPNSSFSCQGWYDNVVAVDPQNPERLMLGGITNWLSENGGDSWAQVDRYTCPSCSEPPPCKTYVDQHDIGFDPQNPDVIYVFNDGGVSKTTDGGQCWQSKNQGLATAQFYAIASGRSDPGVVVGGMQDHGLQGIDLSENTGGEWDRWGFLDGIDVAVNPNNAKMLFGSWITGSYWRTTGGVHVLASQITSGMNLAENNGFFFAPLREHPTQPTILLGSTRQKIYRSSNFGLTWTPVATVSEARQFEFNQLQPDICYAAAWDNNNWSFWRSQNAGLNWSQTSSSPGWRVMDIRSSHRQPGWVYAIRNSINANTPHVYKSTDHGDSWTIIQGDLPDLWVYGLAVNPFVDGVLYIATDLGVFISTNDGENWTEYNEGLPGSIVFDIEFNPVDTTLHIGTLGRSAWITNAWMPEQPSASHEPQATDFGITAIAPNPAGAQPLRVDFFLKNKAEVRLEILNSLGQPVAVLAQGVLSAGEHLATWNGQMSNGLRALPGIYVCRLRVGAEAVVRKVVVD